jgi:hypothetical protein
MKPAHRAHRRDYSVQRTPHAEAAAFIAARHYAKGTANTSVFSFGLLRAGALVGAALWMPPTKICAASVDAVAWRRVLALSRLVVDDAQPTNAESIFLGSMIREVRRDGRWTALVTYADAGEGHRGTIYRATNWAYAGVTRPERRWIDADGKRVSKKSAGTSRTVAEMQALGFVDAGSSVKHKFVMRL